MKSTNLRQRPLASIILAAGKGTRMKSDLPKVAHVCAGKPMVRWVVEAAREVNADPIVLVVGHGREHVEAIFADDRDDLRFVLQAEQLGTGHAVAVAREALADFDGDVLVLCGDGPLIRRSTIEQLLHAHRSAHAAMSLATAVIDDPEGYGRIVRDANGRFSAIVEHKNATPAQRAIREINPSYYCADARTLFGALERVKPNPTSGEYYLTDVPALLRESGETVEVVDAVPAEDVLSINTPEQLAEVDAILTARAEARV